MAPLVVALGPGYTAGVEAHLVVETNRGHQLGRIITRGAAQANTGLPAPVQGFTWERVLRAPTDGVFRTEQDIGQRVRKGQVVGRVGKALVIAGIGGLVRGLLRDKTPVRQGTKLGDIDPRPAAVCDMVSDKALTIGGGVLEALLSRFLTSPTSSEEALYELPAQKNGSGA
jgi:xanthine dehydrogenase accessory factor